jgi:tetratricopeptide (TPR) repeat protein
MSEVQRIFLSGIAKHNAGQIGEAECFYDQVLQIAPLHYEALHFKGVAALQQGRADEAVDLIAKAISIKPDIGFFHLNHGFALKKLGRLLDAKQAFSLALRMTANDGQAQFNLALTMQALGQLSEAEAELRQLVARFPKHSEGLFLLGQVLYASHRCDEVEQVFLRALKVNPQYLEVKLALAGVYCAEKKFSLASPLVSQCLLEGPENSQAHFLAGEILRDSGKISEAIIAYQKAIELSPEHFDVFLALGNCLRELNELERALSIFDRLIAMAPDYSSGYCCRARVYQLLLNYDSALVDVETVLKLDPNHHEAIFLRAAFNNDVGNFAQASADCRAFLALEPDSAIGHFVLSTHLLREGAIVDGLREYEWRFKCAEFANVGYPGEGWQGQMAPEKTLLVYTEQGFGDLLHFARFLPLAARRVGRLILICPPALFSIFSRLSCVSEMLPFGVELPRYDFQASLLSLPFLLGVDENGLSPQIPYLEPLSERVDIWAERLQRVDDNRPLVGLIWQGNPTFQADVRRSPPLRMYEKILHNSDCRFISLQKEYGLDQIASLSADCHIENIGVEFSDFDDTAAVLSQLDLLIASDTSVVNLAGALGVPTWLCLAIPADWRWMCSGETSPWYPTVRIFRQNKRGDWPELFSRVTTAFSEWRAAR